MQKVKKVTRAMKAAFTKTYATYAITSLIGYFSPAFMAKMTADTLTLPPTMAFSNTPGILKKITYKGVDTLGMYTTFIAAGKCAFSVAMISYCENIQFTVNIDECIN